MFTNHLTGSLTVLGSLFYRHSRMKYGKFINIKEIREHESGYSHLNDDFENSSKLLSQIIWLNTKTVLADISEVFLYGCVHV